MVSVYERLAGLPMFLQIPIGIILFCGLKAASPLLWLIFYTAIRIYAAGIALPFTAAYRWWKRPPTP